MLSRRDRNDSNPNSNPTITSRRSYDSRPSTPDPADGKLSKDRERDWDKEREREWERQWERDREARHPHRRTSSDATPRPTPSGYPRGALEDRSPAGSGGGVDQQSHSGGSKLLGLFERDHRSGVQSQSAQSGYSSHHAASASLRGPVPSSLLPPRSHSRADSGLTLSRNTDSPVPMASSSSSMVNAAKTSPSKQTSARTYDSKLVSREMHRLGTMNHLPTPLALAAAASASSLALPVGASMSSASSLAMHAHTHGANASGDNPWASLHVYVLPLFNGEPLRIPIEDLNQLVKRHIQTIVSQAPQKALMTLEKDATDLIEAGMVTLNAKLVGIDDEKLIGRLVEIWGFFWDQVLPYVEGVLLPLQTDSLLSSLYRTPKQHRPSSPTPQLPRIDVRTLALRALRDRVVLPLVGRLHARLAGRQDSFSENQSYQQPRFQQMLLVLNSQGRTRPSSSSLPLNAPLPQATPGELAVSDLLRAVRAPPKTSPSTQTNAKWHAMVRAPSFLSGGLPRDRRGRIGEKARARDGWATAATLGLGITLGAEDGDETPRLGMLSDPEREKEREFLESLRSPGLDEARASVGGWGLGAGIDGAKRRAEDEDEDEPLDWDQAQAVVERMVGMKPNERETILGDAERIHAPGQRRMT